MSTLYKVQVHTDNIFISLKQFWEKFGICGTI